jgi:hypothetical protein
MTLVELKEYLLVSTNQYYIGEKDIEVTDPILEQMVKRAISVYGSYRPLWIETEPIYIPTYLSNFKEYNGKRIVNVSNMYYFHPILAGEKGKIQVEWDYNRDTGIIRTGVGGTYYIELFVMPDLEDIGFEQFEFLDIMTGLYLQYVGSTRKGFTLGDLPFENDGADLYEQGKELYQNTLEILSESNSNWYLAIT